jgi:RNA polymerase sigma factor (sigma-70 family)
MSESVERDESDGQPPQGRTATGAAQSPRDIGVPALTHGSRLPEVEDELQAWVRLDRQQQRAALDEVIRGGRRASPEALVHLCRRAYEVGDRQALNLAFEAFAKRVTPLLLSQARGLARDERQDQAQQILLETFQAIQDNKADFAECRFAAFAGRKAVSLYRRRRARFEGVNKRLESTDERDPLDDVPSRIPSVEARALLACALNQLPPEHRAAFIQYHCYEMTQDEIATHHGVSVRTVYSWLKKAEIAVGYSGDNHDR